MVGQPPTQPGGGGGGGGFGCQLPQMLPPELLLLDKKPKQQQQVPAHGIDPSKIQLPCANCKAILNVPHGLSRFSCPQCKMELSLGPLPLPPPPPPVEEVNEVALLLNFA
ncbi:hypothetical protein Tco_0177029 [Tanacetum coccineum]